MLEVSYNSPRKTLFTWIFISLLIAVIGFTFGLHTIIPGPSAPETLNANTGENYAKENGIPRKDLLIVHLRNNTETTDSKIFIEAKESLLEFLKNLKTNDEKPLFNTIRTAGSTLFDDINFISEDRKSLLFYCESSSNIEVSEKNLRDFPEKIKNWRHKHPQFALNYLSDGTVNNEMFDLIDSDLHHSLIYTLPITFLVLIWAFGSVLAACIPLLIAIISLLSSIGIAAFYSNFVEPVSATASQLLVLLVLAVGVDYSLFIIKRLDEELEAGNSYESAVKKSMQTTGRSVIWSGVTVALSLFGLFLMRDTILTSMAAVSIIAVLVTVLGAILVLPSILIILKGPLSRRFKMTRAKISNTNLLTKLLTLSISHPLVSLFMGSILVGTLCYASVYMTLGSTVEPRLLPEALQSKQAFDALEKYFPSTAGSDFSLIFKFENVADKESGAFEEFNEIVSTLPNVRGPLSAALSDNGLVLRQSYVMQGSANDSASKVVIERIKTELAEKYLIPNGINVYLGGTLPFAINDTKLYAERSPIVFAVVLFLSFFFLLLVFRSIIIPIKALFLNILSTAASFGVLVLIFQYGYGLHIKYGMIESFIPPLLFSILFGLSMDYHVLILSRISEEVHSGKPVADAVRNGILHTSSTVNFAALIMVCVFAVIGVLELPLMKELGIGLAFAVFLDATLIRSVLLPSSMVLLGKWNWYFPGFLKRLPEIH